MSIILQQPDALSFSGNLKTFEVTSGAVVNFGLSNAGVLVLDEKYRPTGGAVSIDVKEVVERLLSVSFPLSGITDQVSAVGNFTAVIDGTTIVFRVIKGGVDKLQETADQFVDSHILSWQAQDKETTQYRPEWLTVYAKETRKLKARVYYLNNDPVDLLLHTLPANKLSTVDVCWGAINTACTIKNPVAWDMWFEDISGNRLSYIQRYRLRNQKETDKVFIWANTLGGWDTVSLTGASEHDRKLEHQVAQGVDGSFSEYQVNKNSLTRQSTGYLTLRESLWMEDFFCSKKRYVVLADGSIGPIVLTESKVVSSSVEDMFDFEFTYRLASESGLLNLDRAYAQLPIPEAPGDFFFAELLSKLPAAQLSGDLIVAVQAPSGQGGWMKLTLSQLLAGTGGNISIMDGGNASNIRPISDILDGGSASSNSEQLEGGSAATANTSTINGGNA